VLSDPVTTDGWRGMPGPDWSEPAMLAILTALAHGGQLGASTAVSFDGRAGSRELAVLACDLLSGLGFTCLLGDEPAPTPALGRFVHGNPGVDSGLAFTASHNPPGYVGFKVRDADGLSSIVPPPQPLPARSPMARATPVSVPLNASYAASAGQHLLGVLARFGGDLVIDAAHGALGSLARHLPQVTWARSWLLPFFSGITPDPVMPANIEPAWRAILAGAAIPERLLAAFTDGDGDRLVLATSRSGYINSTEQAAITCLAGVAAEVLIGTVVTPLTARRVAESVAMSWAATPVGFKHVVAAWRERSMPRAIGLEPNGALAYAQGDGDYFERDALSALALVMQALPSVRQIDDAVAALRDRYPLRPEIITSPMATREVLAWISRTLPHWSIAETGGVASLANGDCRILVRASGTEAVTRIYAEAPGEVIQAIRAALSASPTPSGQGGQGT
jgi:phosphomannomutase